MDDVPPRRIAFSRFHSRSSAPPRRPIRDRRARPRVQNQDPPVEEEGEGQFLPLLDGESLVFRVEYPALTLGPLAVQTGLPTALPGNVGSVFRRVFDSVWARIPAEDRHQMMRYWNERPNFGLRDIPEVMVGPRPKILVVDVPLPARLDGMCEYQGFVLRFPRCFVTGPTERLAFIIARTLVLAYSFASREHWQLMLDVIEDPWERWEAQHADASEAAADRKYDQLMKTYQRKSAAALEKVMRRWGFAEPPALPGQGLAGT